MPGISWNNGKRAHASRVGALAGAATCFLLAFYVFEGAVGFTPALILPARNEFAHLSKQLAPQGWAFFTKDVHSEFIVPYKVLDDDTLVRESLPVGASAQWAFGLDRAGRSQGAEIAGFLQGVDELQWTKCANADECRAVEETTAIQVRNGLNRPTLCGSMLLVASQPVPWEWRNLNAAPEEREALHVDVTC